MLKREREVTEEGSIREILDKSMVLHLGLCDEGQPYVLPMNYGYIYEDGKLTLYLHGAVRGYKYEIIQKNPRVSFALECDVAPFEGRTACQYGNTYASVMGRGTAVLVEDVEEKIKGLAVLMKTQTGKDFEFNEKLVSIVNVIRIDVAEFSAKRRPLPGTEE
ncbi:MAG: pyridoxamine 5'-phosphate oxidase family protein [Roseburia sp.]|nr:pyridoxamine 5'-phosphate oxidase family protein [Roseburia sp.]